MIEVDVFWVFFEFITVGSVGGGSRQVVNAGTDVGAG